MTKREQKKTAVSKEEEIKRQISIDLKSGSEKIAQ